MNSAFFVLKKDISKPLFKKVTVFFAAMSLDKSGKIPSTESSVAQYQLSSCNVSTSYIEGKTAEEPQLRQNILPSEAHSELGGDAFYPPET